MRINLKMYVELFYNLQAAAVGGKRYDLHNF